MLVWGWFATAWAGGRADEVERAFAPAVQGDVATTLARLARLDPDVEPELRRCMTARFAGPPTVAEEDPWLRDLLGAYRAYWSTRLLGRGSEEDGEAQLSAALGALVPQAAPTLEARAEAIGAALTARGHHSIEGITAPYWELMVWDDEDRRQYEVALPEATIGVDVVLLDGWLSRGWTAWATCERSMTGGWVGERELYCMADAYDLDSETFRVSYLAHEAQHFVDRAAWPALEQAELEYRAKLVELALAETSGEALRASFAANAGRDRASPHGFANAWVVHDTAGPDRRAAARAALAASTARLDALGPTATRFLADRPPRR